MTTVSHQCYRRNEGKEKNCTSTPRLRVSAAIFTAVKQHKVDNIVSKWLFYESFWWMAQLLKKPFSNHLSRWCCKISSLFCKIFVKYEKFVSKSGRHLLGRKLEIYRKPFLIRPSLRSFGPIISFNPGTAVARFSLASMKTL